MTLCDIERVFTVCRGNSIGDIYFLLKLKGEKVKTVPKGISFTKFGLFSHSKEEVSYSLKLGENSLVLVDNAIKSKSFNVMNKVVELQDFLIGKYANYI